MPISAYRITLRRATCLALAGATMLATVHGAAADDGVTRFFSAIFGGTSSQPSTAPALVPTPSEGGLPRLRPFLQTSRRIHAHALTVRLQRAPPKAVMAQTPAKPGKVSIFEDRTLKSGDAVMTANGIRVFAGSASWPYTKADFIDLAAAKDLNKNTSKVLAEVDRLPRG